MKFLMCFILLVPVGRSSSLKDIKLQYYSTNSSKLKSYRVGDIDQLLSNEEFELGRPTLIYAHGYIEYTTDPSVQTIVKAYRRNGKYNILILDWSNLAFGSYLKVALSVKPAGLATSKAVLKLIKGGLSREGLHFVGHSLGAHLLGVVARDLAEQGIVVPRLTGLDPAYPGAYPPLLTPGVTLSDAEFVDIIHTDGGGYGAPQAIGHADFWPNGGTSKQPGCPSISILLTTEDFCSHWRSWAYWAEAVSGLPYWARQCASYDSFLRGQCQEQALVPMGVETSSGARGNFYLRTAAMEPFALGMRGVD